MNLLYEEYHKKRRIQKRVIGNSDYTYQTILKLLRKYGIKDKKILDIGCGVGTLDFYLVKKGARVLGIDVAHNGICAAKQTARQLQLKHRLTFKVMKFPDQSPIDKFDVIVCSEVLEHLPDDKLAIIKMKKLLKTNGVIIASSPSKTSLLFRLGILNRHEKKSGHLRRYDRSTFKSLFSKAGFKVIEISSTQGILREFLFVSKIGGYALHVVNKAPFSTIFTYIDNILIPIFGETGIIIVLKNDNRV